MHYKHVGLNSHQVKIGEVLVGVVAEVFLHDRRIDGKASGGANADRVTIRCSLRQARDTDYASGGHPIFDHELLAETRGKPRWINPSESIGIAAGAEGDDRGYRLGRPAVLCRGRGGEEDECQDGEVAQHVILPVGKLLMEWWPKAVRCATRVRERFQVIKKRRTYHHRIVGGQVMMPADLKRLHNYMLEIEHIDHISDEMRAVVEELWPELLHKLPPKRPLG
jgi:hypothetical protein